MRIIAGKYKSRKIISGLKESIQASKSSFRPTTDRAKESLFNTLNNIIDFDSVTCLDLFAGSGSLGFEAISRGAASCEFVDNSVNQVKLILHTAEYLGISDQIMVNRSDVIDFLTSNPGDSYDLVFADPPYSYEKYDILMQKVFDLNFGIFVLEHPGTGKLMYDTNRFNEINKAIGFTNFKIFSTKDE